MLKFKTFVGQYHKIVSLENIDEYNSEPFIKFVNDFKCKFGNGELPVGYSWTMNIQDSEIKFEINERDSFCLFVTCSDIAIRKSIREKFSLCGCDGEWSKTPWGLNILISIRKNIEIKNKIIYAVLDILNGRFGGIKECARYSVSAMDFTNSINYYVFDYHYNFRKSHNFNDPQKATIQSQQLVLTSDIDFSTIGAKLLETGSRKQNLPNNNSGRSRKVVLQPSRLVPTGPKIVSSVNGSLGTEGPDRELSKRELNEAKQSNALQVHNRQDQTLTIGELGTEEHGGSAKTTKFGARLPFDCAKQYKTPQQKELPHSSALANGTWTLNPTLAHQQNKTDELTQIEQEKLQKQLERQIQNYQEACGQLVQKEQELQYNQEKIEKLKAELAQQIEDCAIAQYNLEELRKQSANQEERINAQSGEIKGLRGEKDALVARNLAIMNENDNLQQQLRDTKASQKAQSDALYEMQIKYSQKDLPQGDEVKALRGRVKQLEKELKYYQELHKDLKKSIEFQKETKTQQKGKEGGFLKKLSYSFNSSRSNRNSL